MFENPIAPKDQKMKSMSSPWDFKAPSYDDRNRINAGTHYGVGHNNPVGHEGEPKQEVPTMPLHKIFGMKVDEKG